MQRLEVSSFTVLPLTGIQIGPKLSSFHPKNLLYGKICGAYSPALENRGATSLTLANFEIASAFDFVKGRRYAEPEAICWSDLYIPSRSNTLGFIVVPLVATT